MDKPRFRALLAMYACAWISPVFAEPSAAGLPAASDYVQTAGDRVTAPGGAPLRLRGVNLGNWLLPEGYLWRFKRTNSPRMIETAVAELIGDLPAAKFWHEWRENYITAADIAFIKRSGFNSVRIPLNWRLFATEDYPQRIEGSGWALLDRVIGWCRAERLYVVIDLHGAPGGQTGDNIDDSRGRPQLFTDEAAQSLTVDLWRALASRYRGETNVAGYDLLNEPIAHFFDKEALNPKLAPFYRRLVDAIREIDPHHVIFLGGAQWNTNLSAAGAPFAPNLVYTFHAYHVKPEIGVIQRHLDFRKEHGVPLYLGESGEDSDEWVGQFRRLLDSQAIGWCFWPYKKLVSTKCPVTVPAPADWDKIVAYAETPRGSYEEIRKALPPESTAAAAFAELLENIRLERSQVNQGYIDALTGEGGKETKSE